MAADAHATRQVREETGPGPETLLADDADDVGDAGAGVPPHPC
ncbi:hypothetical protein [Streptomyces olivaceoviridis]